MGIMKRVYEQNLYKIKPSLRDFDLEEWIFRKEVGSRLKQKASLNNRRKNDR